MLAQITKWAHQSPLSSLMLKCIKSTWATMLASLLLGALATLGFAPYHQWVLLLISLAFEIFKVHLLIPAALLYRAQCPDLRVAQLCHDRLWSAALAGLLAHRAYL